MVNSQEIIERSIYSNILTVAMKLGYTLNPDDYLPINKENEAKYKSDLAKLKKFIPIYGVGNNQSKGQKITPRIVINSKGFYPGAIGLPKELIDKGEGIGFTSTEEPYETLDQMIDIHLVASTQEDIRLLHQILFWSIPQRGYIKPYTEDKFMFSGNIFLEVVNFFDRPDLTQGLIEKIYQFSVFDCIIGEKEGTMDIVPITNISLIIDQYGYDPLFEVSSDNQNNN